MCFLLSMLCIFVVLCFFFFKQKTAYEMRISDWSSDVCSSDLLSPDTFTAVKVSGDSPVLIDRYLRDAVEVDVDALCDGTDVVEIGRASCRERVCQYV